MKQRETKAANEWDVYKGIISEEQLKRLNKLEKKIDSGKATEKEEYEYFELHTLLQSSERNKPSPYQDSFLWMSCNTFNLLQEENEKMFESLLAEMQSSTPWTPVLEKLFRFHLGLRDANMRRIQCYFIEPNGGGGISGGPGLGGQSGIMDACAVLPIANHLDAHRKKSGMDKRQFLKSVGLSGIADFILADNERYENDYGAWQLAIRMFQQWDGKKAGKLPKYVRNEEKPEFIDNDFWYVPLFASRQGYPQPKNKIN